MLTNANVTIYNKFTVAHSESYQRQQIKSFGLSFPALWQAAKASQKVQVGLQAADTAIIYLFVYGIDVLDLYLDPATWIALPVKTGKFTIKPEDIIVKGLITDEITSIFTAADLRKKYNDALAITSVDYMDQGSKHLHHWQIGAK